jgi:predicted nucleotidyltransferase
MKTCGEIEDIHRQALFELTREFGLRRLVLFGLVWPWRRGRGSDVDVLVEVDPSLGTPSTGPSGLASRPGQC